MVVDGLQYAALAKYVNGVNALTWAEVRVVMASRLTLTAVARASPREVSAKMDRNETMTIGRRKSNTHSIPQAPGLFYRKKCGAVNLRTEEGSFIPHQGNGAEALYSRSAIVMPDIRETTIFGRGT